MSAVPEAHSPLAPRKSFAAYGLLGLPLSFVALPVYVHLPNVYAQQYGVPLAALGGVLLLSRSVDAVVDPWLGRLWLWLWLWLWWWQWRVGARVLGLW